MAKENQSYLVDANMKPVADSMFLNFWWTKKRLASQELLKKSHERAEKLGISPYNLFAGIDVQADGTATPVRWNLFANKQHVPYTSLGLYAPDWTHASSDTVDEFQAKEGALWVNDQNDPSRSIPSTTSTHWPGVSTYAVEQSAITKQPFVTNFSLGNGNALKASFDYTDAYEGGNDIKLAGKMRKDTASTIKLYTTDLDVTADTQVSLTAKASGKSTAKLVVTLKDGRTKTIAGDRTLSKHWTTVSYDVSQLTKKTIKGLSLKISAAETDASYSVQLGRLAITGKQQAAPKKVNQVTD
ncbi:putative Mannosyl-glycoprotein endo-beta-N-acetylglucosaminidase [Lactiplantibacillus plantarum]|nr:MULTISPECIES: hypothetical protein [Lactiplantibacillus]MCH7260616.1 hypothetical protein [Lactiplantibacillus sp. ME-2]MDP4440332.1 hypothetical protein [Lactiplantibacillus plantarum]